MALYGGVEIVGKPDLENVRRLDLTCLPMLRKMEQYGTAIDKEWFQELSIKFDGQLKDLRKDIISFIPPEKLDEFAARCTPSEDDPELPMNVNSRDQMSDLLFSVLGIGHDRRLKMTKSGKRISTGKKELEKLKHEHDIVPKCLLYGEIYKLMTTYCHKIPLMAREHPKGSCWCGLKHWDKTWRLHTEFPTTRTDTGRIASRNMNQQNISTRTDNGKAIRQGFVSSPGTVLVGCDKSQIEMRVGGHLSQDDNLIRIFCADLDPHIDTARRAFGLREDEPVDKYKHRDPSKTTNFQIFYGGGPLSLYDTLVVNFAQAGMIQPEWLTVEWCEKFIEKWLKELYPGVSRLLETFHYRARRYGLVWTPFGRIRYVPEVQSVHRHIVSAGLRQAGNMPVQGMAADLLKLAMAEIDEYLTQMQREGIWAWPLMTVHDELIVEVEEDWAEWVRDVMICVMQNTMRDRKTDEWLCRVPLKAEGKIMKRWSK